MTTFNVFTQRGVANVPPHLFIAQVDAPSEQRAVQAIGEQLKLPSYIAMIRLGAQRADDPRAQGQRHISEAELCDLAQRPIEPAEHERIERAAFNAARWQELEPEDNSDSFTDRVQPDIFSDQLDAYDHLSAVDVSDAVWSGVQLAYSAIRNAEYDD